MLPLETHRDFYQNLDLLYKEYIRDKHLHYLGLRPPNVFNEQTNSYGHPVDQISEVFSTAEKSLNTQLLRDILIKHTKDRRNINVHLESHVKEVTRNPIGFRVKIWNEKALRSDDFDNVINCLWDERLSIDQQMDLLPNYEWNYRLKYRFFVKLTKSLYHLNSCTIVLGEFGDLVVYPDNNIAYMSWYPECRTDWNSDISPPQNWCSEMDHIGLTEKRSTLMKYN